jgi:hypothetical protein
MSYQSIIIIGAPRSGTNMLRDQLVELSSVGSWPCDEINYIWRHGNVRYPSDEFTPEMVTPKIRVYIKNQFDKLAKVRQLDTVIEKTCANSLRVGFVDKIIPEAKYIFIVRDGMDAVGSALQRWTASLDIAYILQKAKYVPRSDLPYYALRYLLHRIYRLVSREKRLALWGPAMDDIDDLLKKYTLTEVCALQWKACVDKAEYELSQISPEKVIKVKYEDFVSDPVTEFTRLAKFLNKDVPDAVNDYLIANVSSNSVGKGRKALSEAGVERLRPLIASTLDRYNYE